MSQIHANMVAFVNHIMELTSVSVALASQELIVHQVRLYKVFSM